MKYVNLIIDNNSRHTDGLFTYATDRELEVGQLVMVPFNRGDKVKTGYVFERDVTPDSNIKRIKAISDVDADVSLNKEMMSTAAWMRQRYGIKYLDGVKCFVPNGKPAKTGKEKEPYKDVVGEKQDIDQLTDEQLRAVDEINSAIDAGKQQNFLIHGVTSSGKTEIYMQAIAKALSMEKTAIMLVPEIALTKQVIDRFVSRFGKEKIAVLHSKLTKRERFDEWMRVRNGEAKIVIGARIGVFAPLANIGVIILDEEHEATYKSDQTPKYETVDIALKRLMYYDGILILGSATPSVVSYERAREGIYKLIELNHRYNETPLPEISMRIEKDGAYSNLELNSQINRDRPDSPALVREMVYGVLENKMYLDYLLSQMVSKGLKSVKLPTLVIMRMGLYQMIFMTSVPEYAAVNESVKLARKFCHAAQDIVDFAKLKPATYAVSVKQSLEMVIQPHLIGPCTTSSASC